MCAVRSVMLVLGEGVQWGGVGSTRARVHGCRLQAVGCVCARRLPTPHLRCLLSSSSTSATLAEMCCSLQGGGCGGVCVWGGVCCVSRVWGLLMQ